jgi:hypothetical protein
MPGTAAIRDQRSAMHWLAGIDRTIGGRVAAETAAQTD